MSRQPQPQALLDARPLAERFAIGMASTQKRAGVMRVEIILHQHNLLGSRPTRRDTRLKAAVIGFRSLRAGFNQTLARQRLKDNTTAGLPSVPSIGR
jgi:hypothetical protein